MDRRCGRRTDWSSLVTAARAGNADACDQLARELIRWAERQQRRHQGPGVEDASADFAAHILCYLDRLPELDDRQLLPYLRSCLRQLLAAERRRERDRREAVRCFSELDYRRLQQMESAGPDSADPQRRAVMRVWLDTALGTLSAENQALFAAYGEGGTHAELARRFGLTETAARQRIRWIRRRLRERLEEAG